MPAAGIDTPRSRATLGNRPMMTNSVVPIPNAAMARARRGRGMGYAVTECWPVARYRGEERRLGRAEGIKLYRTLLGLLGENPEICAVDSTSWFFRRFCKPICCFPPPAGLGCGFLLFNKDVHDCTSAYLPVDRCCTAGI